jgi:uncharacterized membrane protein YvlD (DUF360 family)
MNAIFGDVIMHKELWLLISQLVASLCLDVLNVKITPIAKITQFPKTVKLCVLTDSQLQAFAQ